MKTRVLVVGGSGFLGRALIMSESKIIDFVSLPKNDWTLPNRDSGVDTVLFLRSISSPTYVQTHPVESEFINLKKTSHFIDKCLKSNIRVIFTSSDVVYGDTGEAIASEITTMNPHGLYAQHKAIIENRFNAFPNFTALRLSLMTGSGSKLRNILSKEKIPSIADSFIRSPINIRYVVDLIKILSIENFWSPEKKIMNLGGREHISIYELASIEAKIFKLNTPVKAPATKLDLEARPRTVRIVSRLAEELVGCQFGFE